MNNKTLRVCSLLLSLLLLFSIYGCVGDFSVNVQEQQTTESITNTTEYSGETPIYHDDNFKLHMLDVGQGLSLLIESNGHFMIYDGGGREASSFVVSYLKKYGVKSLDYMFVSHYDEDHINGLVGVLHTVKCSEVVCPDYTTDSNVYNSFVNAMADSKAIINHPFIGDEFKLGDANILVVGPTDYNNDNDNDQSVSIKITCGNYSYLVCGDATTESESEMLGTGMNLDCDVYVVSHHGSSSSSGMSFLRTITPECSLISSGKDNKYGHPTEKTLSSLEEVNSEIFRTDEEGTIIIESDGDDLVISANDILLYYKENPNDSVTRASINAKNENKTETEVSNESQQQYILNTNSKKFHYPDCPSVGKMSEKNKRSVISSRDELLNQGYEPCNYCNS